MDTFNLTGQIGEEAYDKLCEVLSQADGGAVRIRINSAGGNHLDSLAMYGIIRSYQGQVTTEVVGCCQSAAVLVFAAGDVRTASEHSWFMVHEESSKPSGRTSEVVREANYLARQETQWSLLMEKRTKTDAKYWDEMSKDVTYFSAFEAKEIGLVQKFTEEKK